MCRITQELLDKVWLKGTSVPNYDDTKYRKDPCGAWMIKSKYGDRKSIYGWEIDHIYPQSKLRELKVLEDEIDNIDNLRPMNWQNNDAKGTDYPVYHAKITSNDNTNIAGDYEYEVAAEDKDKVERLFGKYLR
jgi:hypothetical protein